MDKDVEIPGPKEEKRWSEPYATEQEAKKARRHDVKTFAAGGGVGFVASLGARALWNRLRGR